MCELLHDGLRSESLYKNGVLVNWDKGNCVLLSIYFVLALLHIGLVFLSHRNRILFSFMYSYAQNSLPLLYIGVFSSLFFRISRYKTLLCYKVMHSVILGTYKYLQEYMRTKRRMPRYTVRFYAVSTEYLYCT
jgi:hypothetical protein